MKRERHENNGAGGGRRARRALLLCTALLFSLVSWGACRSKSHPSDEQVAGRRGVPVEVVPQLRQKAAVTNQIILNLPDEVLREEVADLEFEEGPQTRPVFNEVPGQPAPPLPAVQEEGGAARPGALGFRSADGAWGASVVAASLTRGAAATQSIPAGWVALGPRSNGGRTRALVIDPTDPRRMWAASAGGGVWRTDNGGQSYRPVDDQMPNLIVSCMVADPLDPQTVYAGTGEDFFGSVLGPRGAGIFKITGDGRWELLPATDGPDFQHLNRLAFSPDGRILMAATRTGLFRTGDPMTGMWTRAPQLDFSVGEVLFDPRDVRNVVAAGKSGEIFFSRDGGDIWRPAAHPDGPWGGRVSLAYARADSSVVYASVNINGGEVWRSDDGGETYRKRETLIEGSSAKAHYLGLFGAFVNTVWAGHPTDDDFVILGGPNVWKSVDGGHRLAVVSDYYNPRSAHADTHCVVADPAFDGEANKRIFFCNDGGVYKTEDIFTVGTDQNHVLGWEAVNHDYAVLQFQGAAGHPATGMILGGTQDSGTMRLAPGGGPDDWAELSSNTGDGGFCAIDLGRPDNPTDGLLFGSSVNLKIFRVPEHEQHHRSIWGSEHCSSVVCPNSIKDGLKPAPFLLADANSKETANFVAPFLLDPNTAGRLLAGGASLWRSGDVGTPNRCCEGPRWERIKGPAASLISAVALGPGNSDLIWVGHNNGDLFVTENGTAPLPAWRQVRASGQAGWPARACTRVVVDPNNPRVVYVAFADYGAVNLWKTADGGSSWSPVSRGLPFAPVLSLAVHPANSARLFAGTAAGVYASEDGGLEWAYFGPTRSAVDELFWLDTSLVAATHGRGMFRIAQ